VLFRSLFEKGYTKNWSSENFVVSKILAYAPPTFILTDSKGLEVQGKFYSEELQLVG
jgi:hypothetical protein